MSYLAQYGEACDYIRELLTLPPETSIQEIIVKFTEEFKRVKALNDSQPRLGAETLTLPSKEILVDAIAVKTDSLTQTGKLELVQCQKPKLKKKKKQLSKSQRLKKLKKLHSQRKDSPKEK